MPLAHYRSEVEASAAALDAWHRRAGAFDRLAPPWQSVRLLEAPAALDGGARATIRVSMGPFHRRWVAAHEALDDGLGFVDEQVSGPFAHWRHEHRFLPHGSSRSLLDDRVDYGLPLGALGRLVGARSAARTVDRIFAYRHAVTRGDLAAHGRWDLAPRRVLVTGAGGLIGRALVAYLRTGGHDVEVLRRAPDGTPPRWDPPEGDVELGGRVYDAVVHLAAENVASGRWSRRKKRRIRESRVQGTRSLVDALARCDAAPAVLVSAAGIGIYGDRGDEGLTEESAPGSGFLAEVGAAWEAEALRAASAGTRVVCLRLGLVLSPRGGLLRALGSVYRAGLGGGVGGGRQWMSWISLDDVLDVVLCALAEGEAHGVWNAVAPAPVRQEEFARTLAGLLHRPRLGALPRVVAKAVFGEKAEALLLSSTRAEPAALLARGHAFRHPTLRSALEHVYGLGPVPTTR